MEISGQEEQKRVTVNKKEEIMQRLRRCGISEILCINNCKVCKYYIEKEVQKQNFKMLLKDCEGSINILTMKFKKERTCHGIFKLLGKKI